MSNPKLCADTVLGLSPTIQATFQLIARSAEGVTVLMVEQNAYSRYGWRDRGYVWRPGRMVLEGAAGPLLETSTSRAYSEDEGAIICRASPVCTP